MTGRQRVGSWPELREVALGLGLPRVEDAVSWGNPTLKAHGKLWCWWSPHIDAACFRGSVGEREALHAADPETFPLHDHYRAHGILLVAGGRLDRGWAEARLGRAWEDAAPKRFLRTWREEHGGA